MGDCIEVMYDAECQLMSDEKESFNFLFNLNLSVFHFKTRLSSERDTGPYPYCSLPDLNSGPTQNSKSSMSFFYDFLDARQLRTDVLTLPVIEQ